MRRAETTVELPSGGSFAIAGLMQHTTKQLIDGFPGLKDLPVLGALFRSRDFQNDETELVVMVSAYLVSPTSEKALASPTDGFVVPTDPETILLGRLNTIYKEPPSRSRRRRRRRSALSCARRRSCARSHGICCAALRLAAVLLAGSCAAPTNDGDGRSTIPTSIIRSRSSRPISR